MVHPNHSLKGTSVSFLLIQIPSWSNLHNLSDRRKATKSAFNRPLTSVIPLSADLGMV